MTKAKLEKLSPAQEKQLSVYRDKWLAIGLATEDYSLTDSQLRLLVDAVYKAGGLPAPASIIRVHSPFAMQKEANRLLKKEKGEWIHTGYGNHDAGWLSFYDFFIEVCGIELPKILPLLALSKLVGWFIPLSGACIVSARPLVLHRNARGALHCDGGPALAYGDGYKVFALNGVRFAQELAERFILPPAVSLIPTDVLDIKNVEQRGEIIKRIGVKSFLSHLGPKVLDTQDSYSLLEVQVGPHRRVYLQMQNPSVAETHVEAVHPDCKTVVTALQYRNFGDASGAFIAPMVLT